MSALKTAGLTFSVFQGQGMPPSRPETGREEKLSRDTRSGVHRELGSQRQPGRWPSRVGRPSVARSCGCGEHGWLLLRKPTMRQQDRRCPPTPEERQLQRPQGDRQEFSTAPEPGNTEGRGRVSILPLESGADLQLQAQVRPQLPHMDWSRHPSALVGHSWSHSTFREGSET